MKFKKREGIGDELQLPTFDKAFNKATFLEARDPVAEGLLPDLLRFSDKPRITREKAVKEFVEGNLYFIQEGVHKPVKLIPQMTEFLTDVLYREVEMAILWKPRGGGGSLIIAVAMWLLMAFHRMSFMDLAGSADQAKFVFKYSIGFWNCIENLNSYLKKDPTMSNMELTNGVFLKCIANSDNAVRGDHPGGLILDEAAQKEKRKDVNAESALQSVFAMENIFIGIVSTFHVPFGLFQEYWDNADVRGFQRYKWNIIDSMQTCTLPYNKEGITGNFKKVIQAGGNIPRTGCNDKVKEYCRNCFVTEKQPQINVETGKVIKDRNGEIVYLYTGCNGKGLKSVGHMPVANVFKAKRANKRETWLVEHLCERIKRSGQVFDPNDLKKVFEHADYNVFGPVEVEGGTQYPEQVVGIDWGFIGQTAVIGPFIRGVDERFEKPEYVCCKAEKTFQREDEDAVIEYLIELVSIWGPFTIMADSEAAFSNERIRKAGVKHGWWVWRHKNKAGKYSSTLGVVFGKWKKYAYDNLAKYIEETRLRISSECVVLKEQLENLKQDDKGKIIKENDHCPDATVCALLQFSYVKVFEGEEVDDDHYVSSEITGFIGEEEEPEPEMDDGHVTVL